MSGGRRLSGGPDRTLKGGGTPCPPASWRKSRPTQRSTFLVGRVSDPTPLARVPLLVGSSARGGPVRRLFGGRADLTLLGAGQLAPARPPHCAMSGGRAPSVWRGDPTLMGGGTALARPKDGPQSRRSRTVPRDTDIPRHARHILELTGLTDQPRRGVKTLAHGEAVGPEAAKTRQAHRGGGTSTSRFASPTGAVGGSLYIKSGPAE
jgi:hypothetical protein